MISAPISVPPTEHDATEEARAGARCHLSRRHLLLLTDGENTEGFDPGAIAAAISRRPEVERPSVYFVAFDVDA